MMDQSKPIADILQDSKQARDEYDRAFRNS
jgi:hypothetical protein